MNKRVIGPLLSGLAVAMSSACLHHSASAETIKTPSVGQLPQQQGLQPGDQGYVGALNNRPSNEYIPTTKSDGEPNVSSGGSWYDYEPSTIKVLMRTNNNPSASGTVKSYNFGYYLNNVLPNEWEASWPSQALEAGAVSIRSYGWYCVNHPKYPDVGAALDNTINSQVFKPGSSTSKTNNAISDTAGLAIIYYGNGGSEQPGFFKAGSYGPGRDSSSYSFYNNAYQNGEWYYANQGKSWSWMLSYYYPGTSLIQGSGSGY
ncbi:SpoIID/LytB domain-containing protein [Alicyclobacillus shizuokensis]|uniref:SpoIID/LytB domain-containing protein n=1 Tax=Alicyclobacillus shizuokensis TaxID=392014 RepID=UPI0009FABAA6|nr:SpoIID/LytB domain-containing protein [Alicyclobacillus shizuokensis]